MKLFTKFLSICALTLLVTACGSERARYVKSPIDNIITEYINVENYSVILADMDYNDSNNQYLHKYKIITNTVNTTETLEDDFDVKLTEWKQVSEIVFDDYQKDLGMTILSKKNGVLNKKSKPAGYDSYVGNKKYGHWQTNSNGSSFWAFYGQYAFMRSMFGWGSGYRYYRNDYDYYRRNYYGSSSYYGRNNNFGTSSYKNKSATWNSKPQSFKSKVRSNVKRSASAKKSQGYSSSKSYGSTKTTRNTTRYSTSGSSRGRSGGFGK